MAADALTPDVIGVRLLGSGRVRFCRTSLRDLDVGDWVALAGPTAEAPGRVVVAPRQLVYGDPPDSLPIVARRLTGGEVDGLPTLAAAARGVLDRAIAANRALGLPAFLTGMRPDLGGLSGALDWRGPGDADLSPLADALAGSGWALRLTWEGPLAAAGEHLFGGLGRLPERPLDLDALVAARFDRVGRDQTFAPEGLPRLGSRVATPRGDGVVRSISTRDRAALVRLDSGDEVSLPVEELAPAT